MPARRVPILTLVAALAVAGCGDAGPPPATAGDRPSPVFSLDARTQLAGLAAAAKDRRFTAGYAFNQAGRPPRTVTAALAVDGSWRVDIPGGALGGQANVAVAGTRDGLFQCRLGGDVANTRPACVKAAGPKGALPGWADPRVHLPFVAWLGPLIDRTAALSVAAAKPLPGARGTCFSVEANSAALAAPVDPGIYCFDTDGTLTGLRTGFGSLLLTTPVGQPPPTVTLPGPVTGDALLGTAAPPPPPSPSAGAPTPSPSRR